MPVKKRSKSKPEEKTKSTKKTKEGKSGKRSSLRDRAKEQIKESKKKGFTAMRDAKNDYQSSNKWRGFFVPKGETKGVIWLTDDPIIEYVHNVQALSKSGKTFYQEILCTQDEDCKGCQEVKNGNKAVSNARRSGVMLLVDIDGYETDDKEIPFIVRPMSVNPTMASILEHRDNNEGLLLTVYDMSKLDRGHSLDVVRDKKDKIQRFKTIEDLIEYIEEENEETAKLLKEKLEEYGDLRDWLKEEIIPLFLDPSQADFAVSSGKDKDEEKESSYSFRSSKRGRNKDKEGKRRSRLR